MCLLSCAMLQRRVHRPERESVCTIGLYVTKNHCAQYDERLLTRKFELLAGDRASQKSTCGREIPDFLKFLSFTCY